MTVDIGAKGTKITQKKKSRAWAIPLVCSYEYAGTSARTTGAALIERPFRARSRVDAGARDNVGTFDPGHEVWPSIDSTVDADRDAVRRRCVAAVPVHDRQADARLKGAPPRRRPRRIGHWR